MSFAAVTGTVVDPHGIAYAYGKIVADFVPSAVVGTHYTYGSSDNPAPIQSRSAGLDATGAFTLSLPKTTEIIPADGTWMLTVTSADGTKTFNITRTITADVDTSATLVAAATSLGTATQPVTAVETVDAAATGTVRCIYGKIGPSYAGAMTSGNLVGVRGEVNVPATTTSTTGGFLYGAQGKFICATTLNNGSGFNAGLFGQLDVSSATFAHTSGYLAPIIADFSTAAILATDALADMIVLLNTSQCLINSIIKTEAKANFFVDLNDLGQGAYLDAGSGASSSCDGHIKVKCNGATHYIRLYASAS